MNDNEKTSRWIHCPLCGGKTRTKVYENTAMVRFPLYCPKCKREFLISELFLTKKPPTASGHLSGS